MSESMRIIVGYDGSTSSNAIFEDLKIAGLPKQAQAVVLTSTPVPYYDYPEGLTAAYSEIQEEITAARSLAIKEAKLDAERGADQLKALFPFWDISYEAVCNSPAEALLEKAHIWKANLIVVGAHGHSQLGRFLGSVSQLVLISAPCSVRVCRPRAVKQGAEPIRILVGLDGSAGAEKALKEVSRRLFPVPTTINVLSTTLEEETLQLLPLVPAGIKRHSSAYAVHRSAAIGLVENSARVVRGPGKDAEGYVREGNPKRILVEEARAWNADCIFVGARGLSSLRRLLLGSVSLAVASRASCSVEVVR